MSGGWTGCGCRHPNVPTTVNGCAFTLSFATSRATQRAHPQAAVLSWPSSPPRTSPWLSEAELPLPLGCCSNRPRSRAPRALRPRQPPLAARAHPSTPNRLSSGYGDRGLRAGAHVPSVPPRASNNNSEPEPRTSNLEPPEKATLTTLRPP